MLNPVWLFAFCRVVGVVALHPVFGGRAVPRTVTVAVSAAFATALVAAGRPVARELAGRELAIAVVCELAIGAGIGLLGSAVFGTIEAAGRFVDDARGANVARLYAPLLESPSSPLGQLELAASLAVFWGAGLHRALVAALLETCSAAPLGGGVPSHAVDLERFLAVASTLASAGLDIAGPAVVACTLVDVLMGTVNRSAPQANVFVLGLPVKLAAALAVTAVGMNARLGIWAQLWSHEIYWIRLSLGLWPCSTFSQFATSARPEPQ